MATTTTTAAATTDASKTSSPSSDATTKKELKDYSSLQELLKAKQNDLVELCEAAKIESKGKKSYLVGRLLKTFGKVDEEELGKLSLDNLKDFCAGNGINTKGTKKDLVAKLMAHKEGKPIPEPAPAEKRKRESKKENDEGGDVSDEGEAKKAKTTAGGKKDRLTVEDLKPIKVTIDGKEHELKPTSTRTFVGWKLVQHQTIDGHDSEINLTINALLKK